MNIAQQMQIAAARESNVLRMETGEAAEFGRESASVALRRGAVALLTSYGKTTREIADEMCATVGTIRKDIQANRASQ